MSRRSIDRHRARQSKQTIRYPASPTTKNAHRVTGTMGVETEQDREYSESRPLVRYQRPRD